MDVPRLTILGHPSRYGGQRSARSTSETRRQHRARPDPPRNLSVRRTHVFFAGGAFAAVVRVRNARSTADDASALLGSVVALVADAHERLRMHVRVANDALAVACVPRGAGGGQQTQRAVSGRRRGREASFASVKAARQTYTFRTRVRWLTPASIAPPRSTAVAAPLHRGARVPPPPSLSPGIAPTPGWVYARPRPSARVDVPAPAPAPYVSIRGPALCGSS